MRHLSCRARERQPQDADLRLDAMITAILIGLARGGFALPGSMPRVLHPPRPTE